MQSNMVSIDEVREVIASALGIDEGEVTDDISQETCANWTSFNQLTLVVALEEQFGLDLSMNEITSMTSLPQILAVLKKHSVTVEQ